MPEDILTVFLSATTQDLASCREAAARMLRKAHVFPVIQEEFSADYRPLTDHLRDLILRCDAVVCLVGNVHGSAPSGYTRSYTQLEFDVARELGKPVFVFLAHDDFVPDRHSQEAEHNRQLQRHYRLELQHTLKCEWFHSREDLEKQILLLATRLPSVLPIQFAWLHVPETPSHFVGRVVETEQLRRSLVQRSPAIILVVGMGGQGKTTLVTECLRTTTGLPFAGGVYCTAYRGAFTFADFLDRTLERFLGAQFDKQICKGAEPRVARLMEVLQKRPLLVVVDGVERWLRAWNEGSADPAGADAADARSGHFEGLDDFLRQFSGISSGSHLILTTRAVPAALDRCRCSLVPVYERSSERNLRGLEPEDSESLLRQCGVSGGSEQLREAAEQYGHHPLALTILGSLLQESYGGDIRQLPLARQKGLDPRRAFDELLAITRQNLPGRAVADRFLQVAAHAEENPPLDVIAAGMNGPDATHSWTGEDLRDQAVALAHWHLLNWNGASGLVSLHPVIKQYFLALVASGESLAIHRRLADWYDRQPLPPAATSLGQERCRVLAIIHSWRCGETSRAQDLLYKPVIGNEPFLGWLAAWGYQDKGVELLTPLIEATAAFERATLLTSRGGLRRQALQYQAAANDLDEAIALLNVGLDEAPAVQLLDLAGAYMNRGNVARDSGLYADVSYYTKALDALNRIRDLRFLFAKSLETVRVRLNRANCLCELGELSAALEDCDTAARLCRDLIDDGLADQTPMLAAVLESRAIVLADLHRWEEGLSCFSSSLELCAELLQSGDGEMMPRIAHLRSMTAVTLTDLGRFPEALHALDDAIAAFQPLIDSGRADLEWQLALAFMNRSLTHVRCARYHESIQDGERAAAMFGRLARKEARFKGWQGHALTILAEARFRQGDADGSRAARLQGFQLLAGFLGKDQAGHGIFLRRSAHTAIYLFTVDPAESKRVLSEAVSMVERALEWKLGSEALRLEASSTLSLLAPWRHGSSSRFLDPGLLSRLSHCAAS